MAASRSHPVSPATSGSAQGTLALDGERELEFGPGDRISVTLAADGPRVIDVPASARRRMFLLLNRIDEVNRRGEQMTQTLSSLGAGRARRVRPQRDPVARRIPHHADHPRVRGPGARRVRDRRHPRLRAPVRRRGGRRPPACARTSTRPRHDRLHPPRARPLHRQGRRHQADDGRDLRQGRPASCRGKGGSMHIADLSKGMLGANGIVGGGPPLICGTASGRQARGQRRCRGRVLRRRRSNQGTTLEAMNLAVGAGTCPRSSSCENNGYAEATRVRPGRWRPTISPTARAGFGMPGVIVDGLDFFAVYEAAGEAIERAREGGGPDAARGAS